ncbi:hypothetical protein KCP69_23490 [Salmonella enterica subsp. enterica]|nr:hypothetical protein KCP69_23490 [Salmonella enterica subsp. enterica]
MTCCLQILRNRVYHGLRCYTYFCSKSSTIIWDMAYNPDDGEGFGMQHFHRSPAPVSYPTCLLYMPGQQRRKIRAWCDKGRRRFPASPHILSLL